MRTVQIRTAIKVVYYNCNLIHLFSDLKPFKFEFYFTEICVLFDPTLTIADITAACILHQRKTDYTVDFFSTRESDVQLAYWELHGF